MDPDDRLTEELGAELRSSLSQMRLAPEFRADLRGRMLASPSSPWLRWLGLWPSLGGHRRALAGVAVAAIAAAVVIPLAAVHSSQTPTTHQYLALVPPGVSSHANEAAPATCHSGGVHLSVAPTLQVTLTPGQSKTFTVHVTGSSCPLAASVTGPSKIGLSLTRLPQVSTSAKALREEAFRVTWTGRTSAARAEAGATSNSGSPGTGAIAAGTYTVILSVPPSGVREVISITVRS
jgi:hypothetical protein